VEKLKYLGITIADVKWIPVTMAGHIARLRMEEMASRYGE
jgi:hypothetical protein